MTGDLHVFLCGAVLSVRDDAAVADAVPGCAVRDPGPHRVRVADLRRLLHYHPPDPDHRGRCYLW